MTYDAFLHSKIEVAPVSGFTVKPEEVNPALKPHQRDAVMLSVQREYCELIMPGYKKLEIRKTCPKVEVPFLCYIYCTKERLPWINQKTGERLDGFVIGEFICDRIRGFSVPNPTAQDRIDEGILEQSCLELLEAVPVRPTAEAVRMAYFWAEGL